MLYLLVIDELGEGILVLAADAVLLSNKTTTINYKILKRLIKD